MRAPSAIQWVSQPASCTTCDGDALPSAAHAGFALALGEACTGGHLRYHQAGARRCRQHAGTARR